MDVSHINRSNIRRTPENVVYRKNEQKRQNEMLHPIFRDRKPSDNIIRFRNRKDIRSAMSYCFGIKRCLSKFGNAAVFQWFSVILKELY